MSHLTRATQAVTQAGYGLHVYVDNAHVFGLDITLEINGWNNQPHSENVGHLVFSPSKRKNHSELVFVEGRLLGKTISAVGKTPARALHEFETHIREQIFA
jgi:hypothetical protein